MAVLVSKNTKIMVQGITGTQASFHIQRAMKYGTQIVAGVVPNKNESSYLGVPLFGTVQEAKDKTGAEASIVFVPAKYAKTAILEAIHAGLKLVVVITSGIPVSDMMEIKHELQQSPTILIGPNTPGVITPQEAYMGIFPDSIHKGGNIGIISRSSTLTYEVVLEINKAGFGESTVIGLGDDVILGTSFVEIIKQFNNDEDTKAIILIGGIGGNYEIEAAEFYMAQNKKKPIIALILDDPTPLSDNKGLAPEILCRGITTAEDKKSILQKAGMIVVDDINLLKNELMQL